MSTFAIEGHIERRDAAFLIQRLAEVMVAENRVEVRLEPLLNGNGSINSINIVVNDLIAATIKAE